MDGRMDGRSLVGKGKLSQASAWSARSQNPYHQNLICVDVKSVVEESQPPHRPLQVRSCLAPIVADTVAPGP